MLYGEELHVIDGAIGDAALAAAVALEAAATTAVLTKTMVTPGVAMAFGFRPTVLFNYDTLVTKGVLTLYKYPLANSSNKVALATINLEDGDLAGVVYKVNVSSKPTYANPQLDPAAFFQAGDQLVVVITTAATGGGYIAGDFQPIIWFANRGENDANQTFLVDRTPAVVGS